MRHSAVNIHSGLRPGQVLSSPVRRAESRISLNTAYYGAQTSRLTCPCRQSNVAHALLDCKVFPGIQMCCTREGATGPDLFDGIK